VSNHDGNASYFIPNYSTVRIKWDGALKIFLEGNLSLQQLKAMLNCP